MTTKDNHLEGESIDKRNNILHSNSERKKIKQGSYFTNYVMQHAHYIIFQSPKNKDKFGEC